MTTIYEKAAGLDIHNRFIIGTILTLNGKKDQRRFERTIDGIQSLRDWITENKCPVVACESTNSFWYPINDCLSSVTNLIVGNAYDMKVLTHKKTDKIDSEVIANLALRDMVPSSHIASKEQRDLRNLMRLRHFLVSKATDLKNRMHSLFQSELFNLSSFLTDPFGKSGRVIIDGIINGSSTEEILARIPREVYERKGSQLQELLNQKISPAGIKQLKICSELLTSIQTQIKELTRLARESVLELYSREFSILCSIPGVGEITAMILLAEIGNFKDFTSGDKLAAWVGLVPKVYQSADHNVRAGITKRGSKEVRWAMTQAAHAVTRKKGSRFRDFYEGKKDRLGAPKTIIALARKMLTIAWHLVVNDELYVEEKREPKQIPKRVNSIKVPLTYTLKEVIEVFDRAKEALDEPIDSEEVMIEESLN